VTSDRLLERHVSLKEQFSVLDYRREFVGPGQTFNTEREQTDRVWNKVKSKDSFSVFSNI